MPIPKPYAPTGTKKGEGEDEGCQYHCRALWQCFRSQRWITGEWRLENRQFLATMHRTAPNCVSNFKMFPGVPPNPHPQQRTPPQAQTPLRSALRASTHSIIPLTVSYPSLKQTAGQRPGIEIREEKQYENTLEEKAMYRPTTGSGNSCQLVQHTFC